MKNRAKLSKLLLCGFMGSGKTTLCETFQQNSPQWACMDLDQQIYHAEAVGPENLGAHIEKVGWETFRKQESKHLKMLLDRQELLVVSLGGGALSQDNFDLIRANESAALIWLNTPISECLKRIKGDRNRPLTSKSDVELGNLFRMRVPYYRQSDCILDTEQQNSLTSVEDLLELLRKMD